ncbi:metallophosphoesterase [Paludibacter sp. 221]|uniref:metallophosphoesterase n=1 Tax=Paludibacter sp. 221 TaxID=2302939 RepID=UPI0013D87C2D|nr:metallophosphoesterase [Paludibacter sp. 221]NDV46487.1 metallophosphoesterase [Paludibacter sp. 221]
MRYGFFIVMLTVFSALIAYAILRGFQVLRDLPTLRTAYLVTTIVMYVFLIVGTIIGMVSTAPIAKYVAFIGHTALIIFIYLIISFLLTDIVRVVNYFVHFAPEGMPVFRKWAFACSTAIIAIVMIVGNYKFNHPKIVEMDLSVNGKATQNKELRIVAASDVHLGTSINKKRLQKYVNMINEQKPDIVLLAGDVFDNSLAPVVKQNMYEDLRRINAPKGVYAVPGNHEYIGGDISAAMDYLKKGGITALRDSGILVDNDFYIVGRDDRSNPNRKSVAALTSNIDNSKPIIMLDHQPYHLEEAEASGIDLQISGHTHDGQFFPVNLIVRGMYENPHGYSSRGNTHYYISSGLGIWGPQYRIGTQSELVIINLKY